MLGSGLTSTRATDGVDCKNDSMDRGPLDGIPNGVSHCWNGRLLLFWHANWNDVSDENEPVCHRHSGSSPSRLFPSMERFSSVVALHRAREIPPVKLLPVRSSSRILDDPRRVGGIKPTKRLRLAANCQIDGPTTRS